jgi:hypothetical protein
MLGMKLVVPSIVLSLILPTMSQAQTVADVRPDVPLAAESAGWENVLNGLLSVFDHADILMLGEAHGRQVDQDLRLRLVRHPDFPARVQVVLIEQAGTELQDLLNRYVRGETVAEPELEPLRTIPAMFRALADAMREVNQALPLPRQVRLILGGSAGRPAERQAHAVSLLRREVLDAGRHAVVIFGAGHVWREHGGLTRMLREFAPGRVFVAEPLTPVASTTGPEAEALASALAAFDATLQSRTVPVLVFLRRKPDAAKLPANPFYVGQAMLPASVTIGDNDDAIVYFGQSREAGLFVR